MGSTSLLNVTGVADGVLPLPATIPIHERPTTKKLAMSIRFMVIPSPSGFFFGLTMFIDPCLTPTPDLNGSIVSLLYRRNEFSSCVSPRSFLNAPKPFTAFCGGIRRAASELEIHRQMIAAFTIFARAGVGHPFKLVSRPSACSRASKLGRLLVWNLECDLRLCLVVPVVRLKNDIVSRRKVRFKVWRRRKGFPLQL